MNTKAQKHPSLPSAKTGVLLVNLGTPDDLSYLSLRRYLAEFLSDPRVVELPRWLWLPLLHGVLLNFIPFKSRRGYAPIWDKEQDESPLRLITIDQADALEAAVASDDVVVAWAMRYGQPSIKRVIEGLMDDGVNKLLVVPLYPQYSAVTTGSVMDAVFAAVKNLRWQPTLRVVHPYFDHAAYIDALAESVKTHYAKLDWEPEILLTSYHGIPQRYFKNGDPYHCHCYKTTRLLKEKLGWSDGKLMVTFQSRFGKEPWLQPYTDETVEKLAKDGVKRIAVITPGFAADCVETIGEIGLEAEEEFLEHGGEKFTFIPCLNDSKPGMKMLTQLVKDNLVSF